MVSSLPLFHWVCFGRDHQALCDYIILVFYHFTNQNTKNMSLHLSNSFVGRAWFHWFIKFTSRVWDPHEQRAQPWIDSRMVMNIIYKSQWSLHVILIKFSSIVWGWFALETLVWLGILSNFSNKLSHQLIKFLKGHFKIHHLMHIWSTMSQESQENWKLASWLMVVGQMNSSDQNWVSLDPISYNFHHMKIIPRSKLL